MMQEKPVTLARKWGGRNNHLALQPLVPGLLKVFSNRSSARETAGVCTSLSTWHQEWKSLLNKLTPMVLKPVRAEWFKTTHLVGLLAHHRTNWSQPRINWGRLKKSACSENTKLNKSLRNWSRICSVSGNGERSRRLKLCVGGSSWTRKMLGLKKSSTRIWACRWTSHSSRSNLIQRWMHILPTTLKTSKNPGLKPKTTHVSLKKERSHHPWPRPFRRVKSRTNAWLITKKNRNEPKWSWETNTTKTTGTQCHPWSNREANGWVRATNKSPSKYQQRGESYDIFY